MRDPVPTWASWDCVFGCLHVLIECLDQICRGVVWQQKTTNAVPLYYASAVSLLLLNYRFHLTVGIYFEYLRAS